MYLKFISSIYTYILYVVHDADIYVIIERIVKACQLDRTS